MRWHIGTSGWHYRHWLGRFYPADLAPDGWLAHYARQFDTVEINSSFYRLPSPQAVSRWLAATPDGFEFAAKASRFITHMKKLRQPEATLPPFLGMLAGLGARRGPVLLQLPPHWRCNAGRLAAFLDAWPAHLPCAFELRDPDWHRPEIYELLRTRHAAFCVYSLGGVTSPLLATADFAYLRLHGPAAPYCGCYSRAELARWVAAARGWNVGDVYVYFDNDEAAYAVKNALELKEMVAY